VSLDPAEPADSGSVTVDDPAPAELPRRVVARIIDTLIVGIPVSTAGELLAPTHPAPGPGMVSGAVLVAFAAVTFGYELPLLARWGQTVGKRVAGIRVVDVAGHGRVPVRRLLIRTFLYAVPLALRPIPILGLIAGLGWLANAAWVFREPRGRAWHDQVAGTIVTPA
jgi:uncharacterized RDD family membrane protein YckC